MNNKRYSVEELESIGMDKKQIEAIIATYEREEKEVSNDSAEMKNHDSGKANEPSSVSVNTGESMSVTSIFDLQRYAKGTLVRFPDFAEGQPFVARVRRPSMLVLAKQGKIPNTLLSAANELFSKGGSGLDDDNENMLADIYSICEIVCEAALKEPTYQQIKDAGIELSDDQLMAIFNYTQTGVRALESFR